MKELTRLLLYAGGSVAVILLLVGLATRQAVPGYALLSLAIVLVVVLPVGVSVAVARRERLRRDTEQRLKGPDAGHP